MKVMAFVMAFYIIMTTPRFPVMLKQLVGFTDSDVSLRLKTVADQAAASSNVASLVPLRIRRSTSMITIIVLNDSISESCIHDSVPVARSLYYLKKEKYKFVTPLRIEKRTFKVK